MGVSGSRWGVEECVGEDCSEVGVDCSEMRVVRRGW